MANTHKMFDIISGQKFKFNPQWNHFHPSKEGKLKTARTANAGVDAEKLGHSFMAGKKTKMVQLLWKMVWQFILKRNMQLPYKSAIWFLGVYPKRDEQLHSHKTRAALFIIARNCKQARCPSTGGWLNHSMSIHIPRRRSPQKETS